MSNKIFNHIKKVIVMLTIILMCSPSMVSAFSLGLENSNKGGLSSFINKIFNDTIKSYNTTSCRGKKRRKTRIFTKNIKYI